MYVLDVMVNVFLSLVFNVKLVKDSNRGRPLVLNAQLWSVSVVLRMLIAAASADLPKGENWARASTIHISTPPKVNESQNTGGAPASQPSGFP